MQQLEEKIDLLNLINLNEDLSIDCKGKCAILITPANKHYCTLTKGNSNINCKELYNYSNFPNACLYKSTRFINMQLMERKVNYGQNFGD